MAEKRFILEVNENQLKLIKTAMEEYFRIRMNQWRDLAEDLTLKDIDLSPDNPSHERIFNDFITRRECVVAAR